MTIQPYDPAVEEFEDGEVEIYEDAPEFDRPQANEYGFQDEDFEETV